MPGEVSVVVPAMTPWLGSGSRGRDRRRHGRRRGERRRKGRLQLIGGEVEGAIPFLDLLRVDVFAETGLGELEDILHRKAVRSGSVAGRGG